MLKNELVQLNPGQETEYNFYFDPTGSGSPNFGVKLKVDRNTVLSARADVGYLHKGIEKMMEYRTVMQNAVLSDRICMFDSLNWNLAHAEAVEELTGIKVPERAKYIRVMMAELSRLQSHIVWYGEMCLGLGFDTGLEMALRYRGYILDLFELITGGRVYPAGYICAGGAKRDLPVGCQAKIGIALELVEEMLQKIRDLDNRVFARRTKGVGILKLEDALRLGATGPVLRASGMKTDVRKDDPYEIYDKLDFDVPVEEEGDAYARYMIRQREMVESIKIIKQALDKLPGGEARNPLNLNFPINIPEGEAYIRNETARGEGAIYMKSNGGYAPYRCKIRTPDFVHMIPVLEHLLKGVRTTDIPAIYWSLDICPTAVER